MGEHAHHDKHGHDKHAVHLELVARLRRQAADVRRLTVGLTEEVLSTPTVPGKWSLKELVCHCGRMEEVFADRFDRMLGQEDATIVPYANPDTDPLFVELTKRTTEEVLAEFIARRERLCRRLESLSPADWHRKAKHPEFQHFDVHFQAEYMAHHEAHHLYQMFQRRVPLGKLPH
jgi:hypothetical protein